MASAVEIANAALQAVGATGTLAALDEATAARNREARVCLSHFDAARDQALADFDWPFARRRVALAELSEDPPTGWGYVYGYPDGCLQPRKLTDPNASDPHAEQPYESGTISAGTARALFTDVAEAVLVYTGRVEDPNLWSPWFVAALGWRLAVLVAMPLTGKLDVKRAAEAEYAFCLARAQDGAQRERRSPDEPDATWIAARD